jgi:carbon storage regulator
MLVLTRKAGEKVIIGSNITITVLSCGGERMRLGIAAPREVSVVRAELPARQEARRRGEDSTSVSSVETS